MDLAADAWSLARRLHGRPGLAFLPSDPRGALRPSDASSSFLASDPVEHSSELFPPEAEADAGWAGTSAAPRWVGVLPYEGFRSLERPSWTPPETRSEPWMIRPQWARYDAVLRVEHATGQVVLEADDAGAADRMLARLAAPARTPLPVTLSAASTDDPDEAHAARIRRALDYIAEGDVYQVNLARRIRALFQGDAQDFFEQLFAGAPAPYGFFFVTAVGTVAAASPELALEMRGDRLRTAPIKGTCPRGVDADADATLAADLEASEKERAELTMAIDLHRNDLGRIARPGSVRVLGAPVLRSGLTVWSRVAEIVATRDVGVTPSSVLEAVLPCGSVTGAPKVRAMEIIAELEAHRRGLYTGAFGYVGRDGGVCLAMAIRTAVLRDGMVEYFAGGGIVAESDPDREVEETRWKASQLSRVRA